MKLEVSKLLAVTISATLSGVKYRLLPSFKRDVSLSFKLMFVILLPSPVKVVAFISPAASSRLVGFSTPIPTLPKLLITKTLTSLNDALDEIIPWIKIQIKNGNI